MGVFAFAEKLFHVLRTPQRYNLGKDFDRTAWLSAAADHLPEFTPVKAAPWGKLLCSRVALPESPRDQYHAALLTVCTPGDLTTRHYHDGGNLYEMMCRIAARSRWQDARSLDETTILRRGIIPTQTTDHLGQIFLNHLPEMVTENYIFGAVRFRALHSAQKAFGILAQRHPAAADRAALQVIGRHLSSPLPAAPEFFQAGAREYATRPPESDQDRATAALNLFKRGLLGENELRQASQALGSDPFWAEKDEKLLAHIKIHTDKTRDLTPASTMEVDLF